MDGCRIFVDTLKDIVISIDKPKQFLNINQEVLVEMGNSYIKYTPTNNDYLEIECIVDFPYVGEQKYIFGKIIILRITIKIYQMLLLF